MRRRCRVKISLLAPILFLLAMPGAALRAAAQEAAQDSPSAVAAKQLIQELVTGQFDKVEAIYDARMAQALPPGKLADGWRDLNKQAGAFQAITSTETSQLQGLQVVKMRCKFENSVLDATVVFNPDGKLGGLSFQPHQAPPAPWPPAAYVKQDSFTEQPLTLVNGKFELPGTLTMPVGNGPFPAVVLVQGSGPHDEDETIGPNKPFKDLAWGLATHGIAVLRYTKRTARYGMKSVDEGALLTVDDEIVNDARAAVDLASKQPKIDPKRIFLLGHSEGGYIAPRIADGDPQIAGIILLAASERPIQKLIVDQIHYLATFPGVPPEMAQKQIAAVDEMVKQIESPDLKKTDKVRFLGADIPASYFLDLRGYDPA